MNSYYLFSIETLAKLQDHQIVNAIDRSIEPFLLFMLPNFGTDFVYVVTSSCLQTIAFTVPPVALCNHRLFDLFYRRNNARDLTLLH